MGVNAQTTVPTFTAAQVLTADQMNQSARTGVPVFADTTARDAGFGGSGEKVLAEGQLCYLESTNVVQYYDGSVWATVGPSADSGLTLISSTTIGSAVSSVTVSNVFSATYDNYRVVINGGTGSTTGIILLLQLGATNTGYYRAAIGFTYAGSTNSGGSANSSSWFFGEAETNGFANSADIYTPFLTQRTGFSSLVPEITTSGTFYAIGGYQNSATSFTGFTITTSTGTITGGTIKVYGYKN